MTERGPCAVLVLGRDGRFRPRCTADQARDLIAAGDAVGIVCGKERALIRLAIATPPAMRWHADASEPDEEHEQVAATALSSLLWLARFESIGDEG